MPSPNERSRNNVRAGVFVTLSLLLGLLVMFIITDAWGKLTRPMHTYTVVFNVTSGVNKLASGSEVLVGGIQEGFVRNVEPKIEPDGDIEKILVKFRLRRDITLFQGARVFVASSLVGTGSWLEINDVGTPADGALVNNQLDGLSGSGPLNSVFGPEIGEDISTFSDFLATLPQKVEPIISNVGTTSEDVQQIVHGIRQDQWPQWSGSIDELMAWAVQATDEIDATFEEGRGLLTDGRTVIADNRDNIKVVTDNVAATSGDVRATGENTRAITDEVRRHTMVQVSAFLDRTQSGLDDAITLLSRFRAEYDGLSSDADEAMGNAVIASQQLKLTMMELRRSPWKLVYQPSDIEIQHELLYESVRSFALAVTDLSAASKSVTRILDNHSDLLRQDPELEAKVRQNLVESLTKYEKAQERLFNILLETQQ